VRGSEEGDGVESGVVTRARKLRSGVAQADDQPSVRVRGAAADPARAVHETHREADDAPREAEWGAEERREAHRRRATARGSVWRTEESRSRSTSRRDWNAIDSSDTHTVITSRRAAPARDPMSSPARARTPFSDADKTWLATHQHAKMLDPGVIVLGVAHRQGDEDDHPLTRHLNLPTVIECYPLRVAHDPSKAAKGSGFSAAKWDSKSGEAPVPWPNTFWLVDPTLVAKVRSISQRFPCDRVSSRGERRSLRTLPGVSLRPGSLAFNPRPRRLSTPSDAFQLRLGSSSTRGSWRSITRCVLYTGSHTTPSARWTPILKDFARRISPPTPRFQYPPSTPFNFN